MKITQTNAEKELLNFRLKHGVTQEKLSDKTGISRATIVNIESGNRKPGVMTIFKLNEYLKLFP